MSNKQKLLSKNTLVQEVQIRKLVSACNKAIAVYNNNILVDGFDSNYLLSNIGYKLPINHRLYFDIFQTNVVKAGGTVKLIYNDVPILEMKTGANGLLFLAKSFLTIGLSKSTNTLCSPIPEMRTKSFCNTITEEILESLPRLKDVIAMNIEEISQFITEMKNRKIKQKYDDCKKDESVIDFCNDNIKRIGLDSDSFIVLGN